MTKGISMKVVTEPYADFLYIEPPQLNIGGVTNLVASVNFDYFPKYDI